MLCAGRLRSGAGREQRLLRRSAGSASPCASCCPLPLPFLLGIHNWNGLSVQVIRAASGITLCFTLVLGYRRDTLHDGVQRRRRRAPAPGSSGRCARRRRSGQFPNACEARCRGVLDAAEGECSGGGGSGASGGGISSSLAGGATGPGPPPAGGPPPFAVPPPPGGTPPPPAALTPPPGPGTQPCLLPGEECTAVC